MARVTKDKCLEIINTFEPSKEGRRKGQLGIDGISSLLSKWTGVEYRVADMSFKESVRLLEKSSWKDQVSYLCSVTDSTPAELKPLVD